MLHRKKSREEAKKVEKSPMEKLQLMMITISGSDAFHEVNNSEKKKEKKNYWKINPKLGMSSPIKNGFELFSWMKRISQQSATDGFYNFG